MPYTIATPIYGQPASASLFGVAVKNAINDLDSRVGTLEGFTVGKPLVKLVQTASQNVTDNTDTAIQFPAADIIDTHGFHDPSVNNTRIIPNVPGYYRFYGVLYISGLTTFASRACWFRKNGAGIGVSPGCRKANLVNSINISHEIETVIDLNGTTDYVEFIGYQDNTASATVTTQVASQFATTVMCELIRAL